MAKTKKAKATLEPLGFPRSMVVQLLADAFDKKTAKKETNEFLTKTIATLGDQLDEDDLAALEEKNEESHAVAQGILEALGKGQPVLVIDDDDEDERGADNEPEEQDELDDETDEDDESETDEDEEQDDEDESETEEDESDEESDDSEDDEDPEEDEEVEVKPAKKTSAKSAAPTKKPAKSAAPAKVEKKPAAPAKKGAKITKLPEGKPKKGGGAPRAKGKIYYIVKLLRQATAKKPITKARILAELVKKFGEDQKDGMMTTINSQINGQLKANKQMVIGNNGKKGEDRGFWIEDMGNYVMPE